MNLTVERLIRNAFIFLLAFLLFNPAQLGAESKPLQIITMKGEASNYLKYIEILYKDKKPWAGESEIKSVSDKTIRVDIGLGEPIANMIVLHPASEKPLDFKIEQQYETSVSLSYEGPHMDLTNWKHHVSNWESIGQLDKHTFISKEVQEVSGSEFPESSNEELVEAVRQQAEIWARDGYGSGDRWVELAKTCKSFADYPCGVGISLVRLKISVREKGNWKELYKIELIVPMGC